jgi:hypothetical protein
MGATVAVLAAANARRAEADLLERFRVSDATAAGRAQTLSQLGLEGSGYLDRLQSAGVIRQDPGGGRYYLDEVAFAAYRRQRRSPRALAVALCLGGVAIILGVMIFLTSARPGP